jgi:hypothetical protein
MRIYGGTPIYALMSYEFIIRDALIYRLEVLKMSDIFVETLKKLGVKVKVWKYDSKTNGWEEITDID